MTGETSDVRRCENEKQMQACITWPQNKWSAVTWALRLQRVALQGSFSRRALFKLRFRWFLGRLCGRLVNKLGSSSALRADSLPRRFQLGSRGSYGSGGSSVRAGKPEDTFLGEVRSGDKIGVKKRGMDVYFDQFLSA
jgi:hypothetical protein